MFTKLTKLIMAVLILATLATPTAQAQSGPKDFAFNFASDYGKWSFKSASAVSSGAQTMTIQGDAYATTPGGKTFYPLNTNAPVTITDANAETVTPSAVTCTQNQLQTTCSLTATFGSAHNGGALITSGTFGLQEAINDLPSGGGTAVVSNYFGGTTTTITTTVTGGSTSFNILDTRNGNFNYYKWGGSAYAVSTAPFTTAQTLAATVTTATGSPYFNNNPASQATNHAFVDIANAANANGAAFDFLKTRTTNADGRATATIVTADVLGDVNAYGADGANFIQSAQIEFKSAGTIAATRVPSKIIFKTSTDATPSVLTAAETLDTDQSALFAGNVYVTGMVRNSSTAPDATVTAKAVSPSAFTATVGSTNAQYAAAQTGANATGVQDVYFKTRVTTADAAATTTVVTADVIAQERFFGADGTNYIEAARIEAISTGTIGATRVPGKLVFSTGTDAAPTVLTTALIIDKDQSTTPSGGLKTATANSAAAGFQTIVADTGSPAAGTTGTNTTGIANQLWYTQIYVPYNMTITNAAILCGGTCTTDKIAIGIYTTDGQTLVKATAATVGAGTVLSGANTWQKLALTATVTLSGPAKYIVGVVTSGTTAGDFQAYPLANGPVCAVQTGMGTLATAFTPATTGTASSCPYVVLN